MNSKISDKTFDATRTVTYEAISYIVDSVSGGIIYRATINTWGSTTWSETFSAANIWGSTTWSETVSAATEFINEL